MYPPIVLETSQRNFGVISKAYGVPRRRNGYRRIVEQGGCKQGVSPALIRAPFPAKLSQCFTLRARFGSYFPFQWMPCALGGMRSLHWLRIRVMLRASRPGTLSRWRSWPNWSEISASASARSVVVSINCLGSVAASHGSRWKPASSSSRLIASVSLTLARRRVRRPTPPPYAFLVGPLCRACRRRLRLPKPIWPKAICSSPPLRSARKQNDVEDEHDRHWAIKVGAGVERPIGAYTSAFA